MDWLAFEGEALYFDAPPSPAVRALLETAAAQYGTPAAEWALLRAYFLAPEDWNVLVALYRDFYYRQQFDDALRVAERAIVQACHALGLDPDWRALNPARVAAAARQSMTRARFLLLALKGASYLELRLGRPLAALERLTLLVALDPADRLGVAELHRLACERVADGDPK